MSWNGSGTFSRIHDSSLYMPECQPRNCHLPHHVSLRWINAFLSAAIKFVGTNFTTTIAYTDPSANRTITLPDTTGTVALVGGGDSFPATTAMAFFQAAAPTGWTQDTTNTDAMLRVVDGNGGGIGGSVSATTGLTATASHTLSVAQMPAHTHDAMRWGFGTNRNNETAATVVQKNGPSGSTGGGTGHTHNISFAPKFIDMIIATKD